MYRIFGIRRCKKRYLGIIGGFDVRNIIWDNEGLWVLYAVFIKRVKALVEGVSVVEISLCKHNGAFYRFGFICVIAYDPVNFARVCGVVYSYGEIGANV